MKYNNQRKKAKHQSASSKWGRRGLFTVFGIGLLLLLFKVSSIGLTGMRLYQEAQSINRIAQGSIANEVPTVRTHLQDIETLFISLEEKLLPIQPLLSQLEGWSTVGNTLAQSSELTQIGQVLSAMALQSMELVGPLAAGEQTSSLPIALASTVMKSPEEFQALSAQAKKLLPRLEALQKANLLPALAEPLDQGTAYMRMGEALLELTPFFAELLGFTKPTSYLLLIQNNHELRATGGFITAVGQLTLVQGEITDLNFQDSYEIANRDVDHPWAPDPMRHYLGIDLMFLRDANWSPDFPTAAQLIRSIYTSNEGEPVDGIITLDLQAVELLIDGVGPLRIPDVGPALTGENVIKQIKEFWQEAPNGVTQTADGTEEWWQHRKDFMPVLGEAAIQRIQSGSVDYLAILNALHMALERRAMQVWVQHPDAAKKLAQMDWDGALRPDGSGDFLALVDSNFGYNKVDSVLERSLAYQIQWPDGEKNSAVATATIHYKHPVTVLGHQCDLTPRYGTTYDDMAARCYFDYVRLYVPAGSRLLDVAGADLSTATSQLGENGTQIFAAYFVAEPGTDHQITFQYELPATIQPNGYELLLRRQAGSSALPFAAQIGEQSVQTTIMNGSYRWKPR